VAQKGFFICQDEMRGVIRSAYSIPPPKIVFESFWHLRCSGERLPYWVFPYSPICHPFKFGSHGGGSFGSHGVVVVELIINLIYIGHDYGIIIIQNK